MPFWQVYHVLCVWGFHSGARTVHNTVWVSELFCLFPSSGSDSFLGFFPPVLLEISTQPKTQRHSSPEHLSMLLSSFQQHVVQILSTLLSSNLNSPEFSKAVGLSLDFTSIFCCLESPGNKLGLWLCFPSQRVACTSCCPVSENLCLCVYMYTYIHIYIHIYIYIYRCCFCHGQK